MKSVPFCILALALGLTSVHGAPQAPVLGDYAAWLRGPDGRVDHHRMLQRLTELGANTYMWLIWHRDTDWDDLHEFLPMAKEAGITVWAYLVPHSESGRQGQHVFPYSEPYRLDYIRWAQEIARLSLEHDNLVGWVIDDFWYNFGVPDRFSVEYTARVVEAGRAINPNLKFYPLMYYNQIEDRFARELAPLVDGVVAAYPRDRAEIERVLPFLHDEYEVPGGATVAFPAWTASQPGDHGFVSIAVGVRDPARASVTLQYRDDFHGPTEGYHFMQMRVDDEVVWEEDVAGRDDGQVTVDLSEVVQGREQVRLSLGVYDRRGVGQFPVQARFSILGLSGLDMDQAQMESFDTWEPQTQGSFSIEVSPLQRGEARFRLPLIVMPAGQRGEYQNRWGVAPTARMIADKVRMVLELVAEGKVEGVVMYCLDKSAGSEDFDAVAEVYHQFWDDTRGD